MSERRGDKIAIQGSYQHTAYYNGPRIQRFWHYNRLKEAEKLLKICDTDTILDIGCGSGLIASFIASKYNIPVLGIDANESAVEFCRSAYHFKNLTFSKLAINEMHYPESSFSKIILLEVIEHIDFQQANMLLNTILKILKPGGLFVVSTPNKKSLWPAIEFLMDKFHLAPQMKGDQHEMLYTAKSLLQLCTDKGFTPVCKKSILFLSPFASILNRRLGNAIYKIESALKIRCGSILLFSFKKPELI